MLNQFSNLSCYEEFEIRCTLTGISKVDILKEIGYQIDSYYFFFSEDGIFNWFDLTGNHVEDPGVIKEIKADYIPRTITKCVIPNSVKIIDFKAFCYCESLTSITIHNNITNIGDYAFYFCDSLKEITIPDNVINIGNAAFYSCESLDSIVIPNSVTCIGIKAFYDCESLKEIIFKEKTLEEVKQMKNYPFGIRDTSIIKCEM
jgi:hypothetical protein